MKKFRLTKSVKSALRIYILENKKYKMCTINAVKIINKNVVVNTTVLIKDGDFEEIEVPIKRRKALRVVRNFLAIPKASSDYSTRYYPPAPMPIKSYGETETRFSRGL